MYERGYAIVIPGRVPQKDWDGGGHVSMKWYAGQLPPLGNTVSEIKKCVLCSPYKSPRPGKECHKYLVHKQWKKTESREEW